MTMDRRCLILDANFQPIQIVDWQRAICYLVRDKAEIIEEYKDFVVRSISVVFNVPKILRVFGKPLKYLNIIALNKRNIHLRDNYTCGYCLLKFKDKELTLDHIIPLCQGGDKRSWLNLVSACSACNGKKGGRTPVQARMPLQLKIYRPTKRDIAHFSEDIDHENHEWLSWFS